MAWKDLFVIQMPFTELGVDGFVCDPCVICRTVCGRISL